MPESRKNETTTLPGDLLTGAWKRQLEAAVGMAKAVAEGWKKVREAQLRAATEACTDAESVQQAIAAAHSPEELWRIQSNWVAANMERGLAYWRELQEAALQTQSGLAGSLSEQVQLAARQTPLAAGAPRDPMMEMMNTAFGRWMDATRQLYAAPKEKQKA